MTRELFQRGDRIGDYEILGRLRAGGMATLFLGRRHGAAGVSRQVVIKVIHPHLAEDELIVKMFIDEARICSNIAHSSVVYVEALGEHEGVYYMVMEYVDGCSLEQLLRTLSKRGERLAPEVAVQLAIATAEGLHAAHETCDEDGVPLGIVHRDVSPSNVLISRDGRVKVIDFGIAKARGRLGETKSGHSLKGKLRYMSPEQAWGREVDRRTDVFALGVMLWELLTCKQLYRATEDLVLLELVRKPEIPPARSINPDVTNALDAVIQRATATSPEFRTATANDLRRELVQAVPGAMGVEHATLGKLVALVRETLGLTPVELERRASTPIPVIELTPDPTTRLPEPQESSVRAAGEVAPAPHRRSRVGLIAIAGAVVVAIAVVLVIGMGRDNEPGAAALTPAVSPPPASSPPPPPPVPIDAGVASAPPIDAAVAVDPGPRPEPRPAVVVKKPPVRPVVKKPPQRPQGVEVDGVLLADEPTDTRPKPRPKLKHKDTSVQVDGTPLSP